MINVRRWGVRLGAFTPGTTTALPRTDWRGLTKRAITKLSPSELKRIGKRSVGGFFANFEQMLNVQADLMFGQYRED